MGRGGGHEEADIKKGKGNRGTRRVENRVVEMKIGEEGGLRWIG
jgi:hypothetical protein